MKKNEEKYKVGVYSDQKKLRHKILHFARSGLTRVEFLEEISKIILDFTETDIVELCFKEGDVFQLCFLSNNSGSKFRFESKSAQICEDLDISVNPEEVDIKKLCKEIFDMPDTKCFTYSSSHGSFWCYDLSNSEFIYENKNNSTDLDLKDMQRSLAIIPLVFAGKLVGLIYLKKKNPFHFNYQNIRFFEEIAETLGITLVTQSEHAALKERVKELTCMHGIAKITERFNLPVEDMLNEIVRILPPAWQFPEITECQISFDESLYSTCEFQNSWQKQKADIVVKDKIRGYIEVAYSQDKPVRDEGPFLKEERNLINQIARQIAFIIERKQIEEDKKRLNEQLKHADRLATIGQLSAAVAHELNEPLGNILGFSQLAQKTPDLSDQINHDLEKIINSALHARTIIRKLMVFARQTPPKITYIDLNRTIEEGLPFFEARCVKENIELKCLLAHDLPKIPADPTQMSQVFINLIVNSVQALKDGGKLTIETKYSPEFVHLIIEDNGIGMDEKIKNQIFLPFFTTKGTKYGTGLGLSVVHGIVSSHGGSITVKSEIKKGSRFEIRLPIKKIKNNH